MKFEPVQWCEYCGLRVAERVVAWNGKPYNVCGRCCQRHEEMLDTPDLNWVLVFLRGNERLHIHALVRVYQVEQVQVEAGAALRVWVKNAKDTVLERLDNGSYMLRPYSDG